MILAIFAAESVCGKPRVRLEVSYPVPPYGSSGVLRVGGKSAEACLFNGREPVRTGEPGFKVQRLQDVEATGI